MHPLARRFLLTKVSTTDNGDALIAESIEFALLHEHWDEAFDQIKRFARLEYIDELITRSYLTLVDAGRLATLDMFASYAATQGVLSQALPRPHQRRNGISKRSVRSSLRIRPSRSEQPFGQPPPQVKVLPDRWTCCSTRLEAFESFEAFDNARRMSRRPRDMNDASWGRCVSAAFREEARLRSAISELESLRRPSPDARLRLMMGRQIAGRLFDGLYDLAPDAMAANSLLPHISDPRIRSGWGNTHGYHLLLQGRYDEALVV